MQFKERSRRLRTPGFLIYDALMPRIARWVIVTGLILAPLSAAAMSSTLWDFRGNAPGDWTATDGIVTKVIPDGLFVQATREGAMYRQTNFAHRIDAMRLTATAAYDMEMKLLWQPEGVEEGSMVELPFVLHAGLQTVNVDMSKYDQWNDDTDAVGLGFPAGAEVLLQTVEFRGWNIVERLEEAFLSAWTFDAFRGYSINFLWGPLIVWNPVAREQMFAFLPPFATSVNNVFYALLAVTGLAAAYAHFRKRDPLLRKKLTAAFIAVAVCSWVLYDVRMSAEIVSYAKSDLQNYVLAEPGKDNYRLMGDFWHVLEGARPALAEAENIVYAGPPDIPLLSFVRYELYPANVTSIDAAHPKGAMWLIYGRPDAVINVEGRLMFDGTVVSEPGDIVQMITQNSFLFRERP